VITPAADLALISLEGSLAIVPFSQMEALMSRVRIESALAAAFAVLAVLTAVAPQWIEAVTGLDPDGGSGAVEWLVVACFGLAAAVCGALARRSLLVRRSGGA
jgi:hypothetical protein